MHQKRRILKRIIWFTISGLGLMTLVYYMFLKKPDMEVVIQSDIVMRETLLQKISATGTINPVETVEIGTQVSGTIEKLYVDLNDNVQAGQVLARMDARNLRALVQESEDNLVRAEVQMSQAQRTLDRVSKLVADGSLPMAELEKAQDDLKLSQAGYNTAKLQLERNRINLDYATIRSPISGIVIARKVDEGQTLAAAFSAPAIYVIAKDLKKMKIEASVDEADIGQVRKGQQVQFTVDAYPDDIFDGVVEQIQLQPVTFQNVVTYTVEVLVDNNELKLMPGMTATLDVIISTRENVLAVPNGVFSFEPGDSLIRLIEKEGYTVKPLVSAKANTVWKKEGHSLIEMEIETFYTNGIKTEIGGNVSEGDTLISHVEVRKKLPTTSFIMPGNGEENEDKNAGN